jgi:hypothetical protein
MILALTITDIASRNVIYPPVPPLPFTPTAMPWQLLLVLVVLNCKAFQILAKKNRIDKTQHPLRNHPRNLRLCPSPSPQCWWSLHCRGRCQCPRCSRHQRTQGCRAPERRSTASLLPTALRAANLRIDAMIWRRK